MSNVELINEKNKLLIKILWPTWISTIVLNLFTGFSGRQLIILFFFGLASCSLLTYLTWKKIYIKQTMYIYIGLITFFSYILISGKPEMPAYGVIYIV